MATRKKSKRGFIGKFLTLSRYLLLVLGSFLLFALILAFTKLPFYAWYRLGTHNSKMMESPRYIVLLSGSGMPGEDGLLKSYYTAGLAATYPDSRVIIAIPCDTSEPQNPACLLRDELEMRGIARNRIGMELTGSNTRQQALTLYESNRLDASAPMTLVTAPDHMYRAVLTFRKAGFGEVSGLSTFGNSLSAKDIRFSDKELKGNPLVPPIGKNLQLRYQFWNHLKYEILVLREWTAIGYYKVRGWI